MTERTNKDELPWYLDRDGKPIDALEWDRLRNDRAYRTIGDDTVHGLRIRTLWYGENFRREPILFDTAIEVLDKHDWEQTVWEPIVAYKTERSARGGHEWLVEWYTAHADAGELRRMARVLARFLGLLQMFGTPVEDPSS
jgi:hypothetical protein